VSFSPKLNFFLCENYLTVKLVIRVNSVVPCFFTKSLLLQMLFSLYKERLPFFCLTYCSLNSFNEILNATKATWSLFIPLIQNTFKLQKSEWILKYNSWSEVNVIKSEVGKCIFHQGNVGGGRWDFYERRPLNR
jgi:hypothetical protein